MSDRGVHTGESGAKRRTEEVQEVRIWPIRNPKYNTQKNIELLQNTALTHKKILNQFS